MDEQFLQSYRDIGRQRTTARRILGVGDDAGPLEIKRAFRALALTMHPDVATGNDDFVQVVNAYLVLTRADPRGFLLHECEARPPDVPSTAAEYLDWWKKRFEP